MSQVKRKLHEFNSSITDKGFWKEWKLTVRVTGLSCSSHSRNEPKMYLPVCVRVCVCAQSLNHVQLFVTPWTVACQPPLAMEIFRQEYWNRLPFHTPGDLSNPGIEPTSLGSPASAVQFSSVQLLSHAQLFATPWTAAHQASLSITSSWNLLKFMSIESVMPSNHFILCYPLLLPPSIFPSISVFSNESVLRIRWPKYWSFSFNISPSNEYSGLISFRMDWLDLLAVQGTLKESSPTRQFKSISSSVLSFL